MDIPESGGSQSGWMSFKTFSDGTSSVGFICGSHNYRLESLRGTNRNQRVEHLRCLICQDRITRVWLDLPKQSGPDREYKRERAA